MLHNAITGQCRPIVQIPLLLICPNCETSNKVLWFFEVNKERIRCSKTLLYPSSQIVIGTIEGWLMMVEATNTKDSLFFFNPVSGAKVMLPLEMNDHDHIPKIRKMVASSAPHNNCQDDSTFVVGLSDYGSIIFCKTMSMSWNLIGDGRVKKFSDIVVIGNLLYAQLDGKEVDGIEIYNLEKSHGYNAPKAEKLVALNPHLKIDRHFVVIWNDWTYVNNCERVHLANDVVSGNLMLVVMQLNWNGIMFGEFALPIVTEIEGFRVLKLGKASNDVLRWVEVEDLGDQFIFVDYKSCRFIPTVGFQENIRRNCIYFAINNDHHVHKSRKNEMGMFCLSDKSFHSFFYNNKVNSNKSGHVSLVHATSLIPFQKNF